MSNTNGDTRNRARDIGIPFEGTPGQFNSITDVDGVAVGHHTLISGEGELIVGKGPVRTGVTAILPSHANPCSRMFGAFYALNGNGEITGASWIEESGLVEGPILLTNTHSVGTTRDAVIDWMINGIKSDQNWLLPIVAETYDGYLNDINGFHVKKVHVKKALESAESGPVQEGNVGGGTGMICYEFKGGIGTSSRIVMLGKKEYTIGVMVQANHGLRHQLMVAGIPVGKEITENTILKSEQGSIIIIVATDAPFLPHQLKRLARRATLGLARTGAIASNYSGDMVLAFSTSNANAIPKTELTMVQMLPNGKIDPFFAATAYATEEAIINALVAAETMIGINGRKVMGMPSEQLQDIMRRNGVFG
jgi:L-aminopeptidase/D-esterase-like protein